MLYIMYNMAQSPPGGIRRDLSGDPRKADEGTRTPDLLITSELLYQLSYVGATAGSLEGASGPDKRRKGLRTILTGPVASGPGTPRSATAAGPGTTLGVLTLPPGTTSPAPASSGLGRLRGSFSLAAVLAVDLVSGFRGTFALILGLRFRAVRTHLGSGAQSLATSH